MLQRGYKFFLQNLLILFIAFLSIFIFPQLTRAQVSTSSVSVDVVPANPEPFDNVTISLSSYAYNLDTVMIAWTVNGKTALSGIGKESFSLTAPAAGISYTVEAHMSLPDGDIEKVITIKPAVMELLWQAEDSYVPPFYKGKAMPSLGSSIKVVAMPEIKSGVGLTDSQNLTYDWQQDYNNEQDASGYGKNYYTYTNDYLDQVNTVSVTASSVDGASSSDANINIGAVQPQISFYRQDKNLGILWEQSLGDSYTATDSDVTIVAEPYFISPKKLIIPSLGFSWSMNGDPIDVSNFAKNIIPLKVQAGTSGTSTLHLDIQDQNKVFESASKDININF